MGALMHVHAGRAVLRVRTYGMFPNVNSPATPLWEMATNLLTRAGLAGDAGPSAFPSMLPHANGRSSIESIVIEEPVQGLARRIQAAFVSEVQGIRIQPTTAGALGSFADRLRSGSCIPVGSVSFLRAALAAAGAPERSHNPYPPRLFAHMEQLPRVKRAAAALLGDKPVFVKPTQSRAFEGFVLREHRRDMDDHANRQLEALLALPPSELVWVAAALDLASVWRYYVVDGEVAGFALIESRDPAATTKVSLEEVSAIVALLPENASYAIDMAVLRGGRTSLLAVRDPLSVDLIGSGGDCPLPSDYSRFLWAGWQQAITKINPSRQS